MRTVDPLLARRFRQAFAAARQGFSAKEIPKFFSGYSGSVPTTKSYAFNVTKAEVFADCLSSLSPEDQRQALYDLCDDPPASRHAMPSLQTRRQLLSLLVAADGRSPLGLEVSALTLYGVRASWFTAASRVPESPAGAITAARALLETTCNTILTELQEAPDSTGDLPGLYKRTRTRLGLNPAAGAEQAVNQVLSGLISCVDGIAALSNQAGDRHGLAAGAKISDLSYAGLAVHAAGTTAVFLVRVYKDVTRGPSS